MNSNHLTLLPHTSVPASGNPFFQFEKGSGSITEKNKKAYQLYSLFYPLLALGAYKLIWRGRLFKHIRYFKDSLATSHILADIATGDGTLTQKALFSGPENQWPYVSAVDISKAMLSQASKKLPGSNTRFILGDAENLPFPDDSVPLLTCFGGFNSFIHPQIVMNQFFRVLNSRGRVRGSVLLTPESAWRIKAIDWFIDRGLQSMHIHEDDFKTWAGSSGFKMNQLIKYGDVLLFEMEKP